MRNAVAVLILAVVSLSASVAQATVPTTLTQQGRLLNSDGTSAAGPVMVVFAIYAADTGGTALWNETQMVNLDDGYFSVQLGSVTPIPSTVWDGAAKFLGITVGTDSEMTPRETLSSVPYALVAGAADTAIEATGDIHPHSVTVNGLPVIKADGTLGIPVRNGMKTSYANLAPGTGRAALVSLTITPNYNASAIDLSGVAACTGHSTDTNPASVTITWFGSAIFCIVGNYCPYSYIYMQPSAATSGGSATLEQTITGTFVAGTPYTYTLYGYASGNLTGHNCNVSLTGSFGDAAP